MSVGQCIQLILAILLLMIEIVPPLWVVIRQIHHEKQHPQMKHHSERSTHTHEYRNRC